MTKKILIIEDDTTLGDILVKKLEETGYEATLVVDGAEGLEMIKTMSPDLVLLDIVLPSLNGYEILEAKKNSESIANIPVVIISNSGQPVELQRTIELGARDYFIKAELDPDEIIEKVQSLAPLREDLTTLEGKTVLLIEDDSFLSDVLSKKLSNESATILNATTGEEAVELVQSNKPDIILLDLVLPGMNGFETLQKIREAENTRNTHIIILSNLSQQEDIERAKSLGADTFLVKALSTPGAIFDTVRTTLSSTD